MKAIIYARWSSLEQSKGSSLERQIEICRSYCEQRGWTVAYELQDAGKSAFTGANISEGKLGELTKHVENGLLREPTVLVVEQLDRISRLPPGQVIAWIQKVVGYGLSIATANDRILLDRQNLEADPIGIISTVFNSFRAFQESKHKSERLAASWQIRRKAAEASQKPITTVCPAWLSVDPATGKFSKLPERVAIVMRIFEENANGFGIRKIASRLNEEGVDTWGKGKRKGEGWHASYIQKILGNPAVLGEFQPHTRPRGGVRAPSGDPITNYFPAVIDEATFALVNSGRKRLPGGAIKNNLPNLFSGRTRCSSCGATMTYIKKQSAGAKKKNRVGERVWSVGQEESYLVCSKAYRHFECTNRNHFNYLKVEAGVTEKINHLVLDDTQFERADEAMEVEQEMVAAERHVANRKAKAKRLLNLLAEKDDLEAKRMWHETKIEVAEGEERLAELQERFLLAKGAVSPAEHVRRIRQFVVLINDADHEIRLDARRKIMIALKDVIDQISFDKSRKVTVTFLGGAHNVKLSDKGAVEQEHSFVVELAEGDKLVTLSDGTEVVLPIATLRAGLVGDDPLRQSKLDKLLERDERHRTGLSDIEAEEKAKTD